MEVHAVLRREYRVLILSSCVHELYYIFLWIYCRALTECCNLSKDKKVDEKILEINDDLFRISKH